MKEISWDKKAKGDAVMMIPRMCWDSHDQHTILSIHEVPDGKCTALPAVA